jgi:hypothetical protein
LNPSNGNALAMYDTSLNILNEAIAQQQAAGADTSALTTLKAQLESALSEAGQGRMQTIAPTQQIVTQAETLVPALQALLAVRHITCTPL